MIDIKIRPRPLALIILDGWGHRDDPDHNAIAHANKPYWESLLRSYPNRVISGSGRCVGLPEGQMGNSEVGHLNMGAGRIIHQDFMRINMAIEDESFFHNETFIEALRKAKAKQSRLHILGLLSQGGVHSHERHIQAIIKLAALYQIEKVFIHAFLDGRDTPPKSAERSIKALEDLCREVNCGKIVSLIGRYYAMDRDKRWDRIAAAFKLLVLREAQFHAQTPIDGLHKAYARSETDEFVQATCIGLDDEHQASIQDDDVIFFMNFRADRARELTEVLIAPDFKSFPRAKVPKLAAFVGLTQYDSRFPISNAFPPQKPTQILAECISQHGLSQLRIAETEKYAHVTFFFNGGIEQPFPHEDRILIPSPQVHTYDLVPEMSAFELTDRLVTEIKKKTYDLIICNFANADMVGHTGNFRATVKAIETIDQCLIHIIKALQETHGEAIITADHGNAEQLYDEKTKQAHTAHTNEPVPFIYVGRPAQLTPIPGKLSDIAPTILYLMGLPQPAEMTGQPLIGLR